jgi:Holliday junction resolvase RusA-like endonuclease
LVEVALIAFTIPGQPQGKGRPLAGWKFAKGGVKLPSLRTPQKTVQYEGLVAHAAQQAMAGAAPIEGPCSVTLAIDCQVPASWSQKKRRMALAGDVLPTTKPDADNVVKAVFDGLNGVAWRDDVQVVDLRVRKRYAATPCVRVEIVAKEEATVQMELAA